MHPKDYKYKYCFGFRDHHWDPKFKATRDRSGTLVTQQCDGCNGWRVAHFSLATGEQLTHWVYDMADDFSPSKNIDVPVERKDIRKILLQERSKRNGTKS